MTRFVCISDTHLRHGFGIPEGDVLIHAGDATFVGDLQQIARFAVWYGSLPHKVKIFVAGNHDWGFQKQAGLSQLLMLEHSITYLQDSGCEVNGIKIWGSPWQPEFNNWAFNLSRFDGSLAARWALIPDGTQVLITHGPPHTILDLAKPFKDLDDTVLHSSQHVGCHDLLLRVEQLKELRLHVFGHVHAAAGVIPGVTTFVNASICDERYNPTNTPYVMDL